MNELDKYFKLALQASADVYLFRQWLIKLYKVNESLNSKYDGCYFNIYYITLSELLNPKEGMKYIEQITSRGFNDKQSLYFELKKHLDNILQILTEEELLWINYKRDTSCHIFQDSYNYIKKENFKEREKRNGIPLFDILQKIEGFLLKHDCDDKKADIYIFNKLYPYISKMFQDIVGLKG